MIAKCLAILAVVAQIHATGCNQQSIVLSASQSFPVNVVSTGNSGGSFRTNPVVLLSSEGSTGNSDGVITRNVVAKGKYPVALRNCGPTPDRHVPITTSTATAPVQVKPTIRLSANIPAPRTVSHSCTCYKQILRPRVHQHIVTVPSVERYLETTHKPVVENIQYEGVPVNCQFSSSSFGSGVQLVAGGSSSGSSQVISLVPAAQTIEIPSQSQQIQTVQLPQIQAVEIPQVQTFQAPQIQVQTLGSDCY